MNVNSSCSARPHSRLALESLSNALVKRCNTQGFRTPRVGPPARLQFANPCTETPSANSAQQPLLQNYLSLGKFTDLRRKPRKDDAKLGTQSEHPPHPSGSRLSSLDSQSASLLPRL